MVKVSLLKCVDDDAMLCYQKLNMSPPMSVYISGGDQALVLAQRGRLSPKLAAIN
jgi:hypothetical protein